MITIRHIDNQIHKRAVTPPREVEWAGQTLADLAPEGCSICVCPGPVVVKQADQDWADVKLPDGAHLTFVGAPGADIVGGIIDLVTASTLVAINVLAPLFTIGTLINLAIGAYGELRRRGTGNKQQRKGGDDSPSFGFDDANPIHEGLPVPVPYGLHRSLPHVIQYYRTVGPSDNQIAHILLAIGEGTIQAIGDKESDGNAQTGTSVPAAMRVNEIDAQSLLNTEVSWRLGTLHQTVMPGWNEVVNEYAQAFTLDDGNIYEWEWETRDPVNAIRVELFMPEGLFHRTKRGSFLPLKVAIIARVFETDGTTQVGSDFKPEFNRMKTRAFFAEFRIDSLPRKRYIIKVKRDPAFLVTYRTEDPFRVWRDRAEIINVHEIRYDALTYPMVALVGLKIEASEQIHGGIPKVTVDVKGRKVITDASPSYKTTEDEADEIFSQNPAWIARDMLRNARYGAGGRTSIGAMSPTHFEDLADYCDVLIPPFTGGTEVTITVLDFSNLAGEFFTITIDAVPQSRTEGADWIAVTSNNQTATNIAADLNTADLGLTATATGAVVTIVSDESSFINSVATNSAASDLTITNDQVVRHQFNGIFDQLGKFWDLHQEELSTCRSIQMTEGTNFRPRTEKATVITQVFSMANVKDYDFLAEDPADYPNWIRVRFLNETKRFRIDSVDAMEFGLSETEGDIEPEIIEAFGITNPQQAKRHAEFLLRKARRTGSHKFTVGINGLVSEPFDVIGFSHDVMQRSDSGRLAGTTATGNATLDQSIVLDPDRIYLYRETDDRNGDINDQRFSLSSQTTGADLTIKPSAGFDATITVTFANVDSSDTITVTVDGTLTTGTADTEFAIGVDGNATATNLAAWLNGLAGISASSLLTVVTVTRGATNFMTNLVTNDATAFAIVHANVIGRHYVIGEAFEADHQLRINKISFNQAEMNFQIEAEDYFEDDYLDGSESLVDTVDAPTLSTVNAATALACTESSTVKNVSRFACTWTGATDAAAYAFWYRIGDEDDDWTPAMTATNNAAIYLAPQGKIQILDYTGLSGNTVTITLLGVPTVFTEGAGAGQWQAVTSNDQTATNLAALIDADANWDGSASTDTVTVTDLEQEYMSSAITSDASVLDLDIVTVGPSGNFDIEVAHDLCIRIGLQTINADGNRNDEANWDTIIAQISRENNGTDLLTYVGDIPAGSAAFAVISGNQYTLSWSAASGATGYEVRIGGWECGRILFRGAATSFVVETNREANSYFIRAFNATTYSPDVEEIASPTNQFSTFATLARSLQARFDENQGVQFRVTGDAQEGFVVASYANGLITDWTPEFPKSVLQTETDQPFVIETHTVDLGSDANTHVSVAVRVAPYMLDSSGRHCFAMKSRGFLGEVDRVIQFGGDYRPYVEWTAELLHSDDGQIFHTILMDTQWNENLVVNAQYFRLRVTCVSKPTDLVGTLDIEELDFVAAALIEKMNLTLFR